MMIAANPLTLSTYLDLYASQRDLKPATVYQLSIAVRMLNRHAGRTVLVSSLNDDLINGFLDACKANGRAYATLIGKRRCLVCLWRAAWQDGLVDHPPKRLRKYKYVPRITQAWTPEEVSRLLAACEKLKGAHAKLDIPWRLYFSAMVRFGWDTGLRVSDLLRLQTADVREDGKFIITQEKTGWPKYGRMHPETLAAINATYPPVRQYVFPMPFSREYFMRLIRRLVRMAGIRPGGMQWLRRAGATDVEKQFPGGGSIHLGHQLPGIAGKNYLDISQLAENVPLPTKLVSPKPASQRNADDAMLFNRVIRPPQGREESDHDFTD